MEQKLVLSFFLAIQSKKSKNNIAQNRHKADMHTVLQMKTEASLTAMKAERNIFLLLLVFGLFFRNVNVK